ncbi:MAG: M56 family metallopeptidase, partial [Candidatus Solibacter sp.]
MELPNVLVKVAALIVRPLVLAAIAGVALAAFRVKSPAVRHAIWLQVVIGMLLLAVAAVVALPTLPVRILPPRATPAAALIVGSRPPVPIAPSRVSSAPRPRPFPWNDVLTAVYLVGLLVSTARLAFGLLLARRLVGRARRLANFAGERVLASDAISVPMTLGWFRPVILLPSGWDKWPEDKLQAVMVHERTHVARGDWAVGLLASVNRCVFWFHPLAWWLERHLRLLAEFACDDASLAQVPSRDKYAEVLVEMAAAVGRRD